MSRPIKITPELLEDARSEFEKQIQKMKLFDGKISFTKTYKWKDDDKATVLFTPEAYIKMFQLIQGFDSEVAWHGVAKRDEENDSIFYIEDILVYPQVVTGATVNTDQEKYQSWLMGLSDNVFNNVRMQGHSHVNMSPTPSSVDTTHQEAILNQLDDEMFYIFMIWNKSMKYNVKIFDLKNNTLYETDDVLMNVMYADGGSFLTEAKELVVRQTYYTNKSTYSKSSSNKVTAKETKNDSIKAEEKAGNGYKGRGRDKFDDYHGYGAKYGSGYGSAYDYGYGSGYNY